MCRPDCSLAPFFARTWHVAGVMAAGLILLIASLGAAGVSLAEEAGPVVRIVGFRLGIEGAYKLGLRIPAWVMVKNEGQETTGRLRITLPDGDGVPCGFVSPPLVLPAGATQEIEVLAQVGRPSCEASVSWNTEDDECLAKASFHWSHPPVPSGQAVYLWLGAKELPNFLRDRRGESWVEVRDPAKLPREDAAYESVRCAVLAIGDGAEYVTSLRSCGPQMEALRTWIQRGGRLVVSLRPQMAELVQAGGLLEWAAPGRWVGTVVLRKTGGLEGFVDSPRPVVLRRSDVPLEVHQFANIQGIVVAAEGNIPLVIRRQEGFGTIVFFTADLTHRALVEWNQWDRLLDRLIGKTAGQQPQDVASQPRTLMHYGYSDLAGQLRSSLNVFPSVWVVSFSFVAILAVVYLAIIGIVDYWVLGRWLKKPRWTWLTFPLFVGAAIGLTGLVGQRKGEKSVVREVDWIDYDLINRESRGRAWATVYTLRPGTVNARFSPPVLGDQHTQTESQVGWWGILGRALGGMENPVVSLTRAEPYMIHQTTAEDVTHQSQAAVVGLPVAQWDTRAVQAWWRGKLRAEPLSCELTDRDGIIRGRIRNNLAVSLADAVLVYGNWAYSVGALKPGETWQTLFGEERRELRSWLNGREIIVEGEGVRAQTRQRVQPYDQGSRDVGYVLRMMAFYEVAGGERYTGLSHGYWATLDGSDWLLNGSAVLIARVESPQPVGGGFRLQVPSKEKSPAQTNVEIHCRFLIPVSSKAE